MTERGITKKNLLRRFPRALRGTESIEALADATAEILAQQRSEIQKLLIYAGIDRADEALLDILAEDFNVYWWDADASIEQKRRTIKAATAVSRITGTVAAVERQVDAVYPGARMEEWFSYGGEPGHFRVTGVGPEMVERTGYEAFLRLLGTVKRESTVLDGVTMVSTHKETMYAGVGAALCRHITIDCEHPAHSVVYLTDENGDLLADEDGNRYIDNEED